MTLTEERKRELQGMLRHGLNTEMTQVTDALHALCEALQLAGVETVTAEYSGLGDSGQVEYVNLDPEPVCRTDKKNLEDLAINWVDMALWVKVGGWANNDGGQGTVAIDVADRTAHFDHEWNELVSNDDPFDIG